MPFRVILFLLISLVFFYIESEGTIYREDVERNLVPNLPGLEIRFLKKEEAACSPLQGNYPTFNEAITACQSENNCNGVTNLYCDDHMQAQNYHLCLAGSEFEFSTISHLPSGCIWEKKIVPVITTVQPPLPPDVPQTAGGAPCMALEFTSYGGAASLPNKLLGTYVLQDAKGWVNDRVVYYSSQTGQYLFWMNTFSAKIKGEHGFWLLGPRSGENQGLLLNYDCDDVKYPANGGCPKFWKYWSQGRQGRISGSFKEDTSITISCKDPGFIPTEIPLGDSCGSCYCPPTYTLGNCAKGLICQHNALLQDAPGICVKPDNV